MPNVSPVKQSPIAEYLTSCKARTVKNGNVCHFISSDGAYIGRQIKIEQNSATAYIREIYADGFKRLLYECKIIGQRWIYCIDDKSPIGVSMLPSYSYMMTHIVDFLSNTVKSVQKEMNLRSKTSLRAIDQNVNVGIYDVQKPYLYAENVLTNETKPLKKRFQIHHTLN